MGGWWAAPYITYEYLTDSYGGLKSAHRKTVTNYKFVK